ncbi:E3 SUMO-protein ligase PIAS3-like, partial [Protobothrops mucrosquamatus]|uniref:E3 SUMO-protein ligase PIAS3-like n=1 Tax=Protobothrops mucrosquamatus TaxID=103944 RepID=UPI00077560BD
NYSLSVYLVKQLTSVTLLQKLRAKGIRNPDHSRALSMGSQVCGKVIWLTSCKVASILQPPSRDAALPVGTLLKEEASRLGSSPVLLFMEILNSVTDCDEIQFMEDGSWCPMKPKKENQEVCQPSAYNGLEASLYTVSSEGKPLAENKKKVEVIDLTLDSSSDDEELLAKKVCSVAIAAIPPAAGPKWVLNADHQTSSVLRSPSMAAMGSEFLSSLPLSEYHPSYPVPSDIQGLDLFSFLQSENQHYGPSVITSSDEQESLSHFFQYRGPSPHFMSPLSPIVVGSHNGVGSPTGSRMNSVVSSPTASLRESHGAMGSSPALPGCRPDIISLD